MGGQKDIREESRPAFCRTNNALNFAAAAPASRAQCGPGSAGNQSNAGANKPRKLALRYTLNRKEIPHGYCHYYILGNFRINISNLYV
jgi:hypothetical protein